MGTYRKPNLNTRLRVKRNRDAAHNDVKVLFSLLPGPKNSEVNPFEFQGLVGREESLTASIRKRRLIDSFLKKYPVPKVGVNPRENAKEKFLSYELLCSHTNENLRRLRTTPQSGDSYLQTIMLMAQSKIGTILGDFSLSELLKESSWGPGTTSSCKGSKTDNAAKFASRPEVSREFLGYARLLMPLLPAWSASLCDVDYGVIANPMMPLVKGNRVTFVPKTSEIHRVIAVEPHINSFFQSGLGRIMRKRMRKHGIDLNDQSLNQRLAHLGSVSNNLATIDLEGASDCVSIELVRDLLPPRWFDWLDASRSHYGTLDGEEIRYQKFSSMGNGFTFDLESIIFYSLSWAVCVHEGYNPFWVNTFGDDIVVPSGIYERVASVLAQVGFKVNLTKSFSNSPFRESCGKEYWCGHSVRPIYLKRLMLSDLSWIQLANSLLLLAHSWADFKGLDVSLKTAYDFCVSRVPPDLRKYRVPAYVLSEDNTWVGNSDTAGLFGNFSDAVPVRPSQADRVRSGWDGWLCKGILTIPITQFSNSRSVLIGGIFKAKQQGNDIPVREQVSYREGTYFIPHEWYDVGSWVSVS